MRIDSRFAAIGDSFAVCVRRGSILAPHGELLHLLRQNRPDRVQHVDFFVAHFVGLKRGGRLHRHQTQQLQQVVLNHVPQRAGAVIVAAATTDADLLGNGDLDMVDKGPVPQRFPHRVGKPERQDVLHRFLAKVMVHAVDLRLAKIAFQQLVQFTGRCQVMTEGLLHHDPVFRAVPIIAGLPQPLDDRWQQRRRRGQVKDLVGGFAPTGVHRSQQSAIGGFVFIVGRQVLQLGGKFTPVGIVRFAAAGKLVYAATQLRDILRRFHRGAGETDDAKLRRQPTVQKQVIQGRNDLAAGQVA